MQNKRVALITGANQGIGLQIVKDLAAAGLIVLIGSRDLKRGEDAARTIDGEAHAVGTREILVVLSGALRMHVGESVHELAAGDSVFFAADEAHVYENPGSSEARYHNLILYAR